MLHYLALAIAILLLAESASICQGNVFWFKVQVFAFIEDFSFACFAS